jgi:NADH dehydrogenase
MKPSLFITGAGGFVGKQVLARLDVSRFETVYCLELKMESVQLPDALLDSPKVKIIEGDLLEVASYQHYLSGVDTVIHLAAITGKAHPDTYSRVNAYATMLLLDRCKQAGVKHFLFISSIAVAFKNKYRYFYAHSKEQAEGFVKSSGLKYAILRPTMIMGKGAPVFAGLAQLAGLPVIPVFGRGNVDIQPIDVEDVAKAILKVVYEEKFGNEILELGGPETIKLEEFLKQIARAKGKENPGVIHLPISLFVFFLSIMERVLLPLLPLTVGQLASFRNDNTAESNWLIKKTSAFMINLEDMIARSLEKEPPPDFPKASIKECRVFTRYLVKQEPTPYVLEKYRLLHQTLDFTPADFHDSLLLKLAAKGFFFTRMADGYSRFFRSNSTVRKKLAYLMAILEVTPPYFRFYDTADKGGKLGLLIKTGIKGGTLALHLLFSFIFLFPFQVLAKLTTKGKKGKEEK